MTDFTGLYDIRDFKKEDTNFILVSFLRGTYYGNSFFNMIPKDIFMLNYKKVAQFLVSSPTITIKVACLKDDTDTIIGYSILSADFLTLHWVYVKHKWRRKGICKNIVPSRPVAVSHLTELGKSLLHKLEGTKFNPFAINQS